MYKSANTYSKTQAQISKLTAAYNDLATRKERYNNLSENEEKRLNTLQAVTSKYNTTLKDVDATIGKHTRNVGNYASGWNGLGNSINQLAREMPAFANSMQTGFMAISNNLPMLFDEISRVKQANVELAKSGEPTKSVFKQLAREMFSWGTALSVGVTLLTVYGKDIVEFIATLFKAEKGIQSLTENQKELNVALSESSGSYAEQKVNIDVLYKTATDLNKTYKERKDAVDDLQKQYPFYFKNLSDEEIMTGKAKDQYLALGQAILTVAQARAAEEILQKRESERLTKEQEQILEVQKKYKELANAKGTFTTVSGGGSVAGASTQSVKETAEQQKARLKREIQAERNDMIAQREKWAKEDAFFVDKIAKGNTVKQTLEPAKEVNTRLQTNAKKAREKEEKDSNKKVKKEKEFDEIADAQKSWEIFKKLQEDKEKLAIDVDEQMSKAKFKKMEEDWEKEQAILKQKMEFMKSYVDEFVGKMGFTETFRLFDGEGSLFKRMQEGMAFTKESWKEDAVQMMEGFQEVFNFISNASQANFDAEYTRLESQKDIAIQFAGDSAGAKKKIEEDFDKKKREIANREAKAKKKQAMFNIAIDTAQAVIGSLRLDPTGILGIIIGAMGALQLGLVAAQKIPQYWKGTDHAQSGLAWTNEKGAEIHTDKYGNIKSLGDNKGPRLTMMEQGDKVYTANESQRMLQDKMLNDMLIDRGISINYNSNNTSLTYAQMKEIMTQTLGNKPEKNIIFDKNGFSTYIRKSGNITRYTNQRAAGVGMTV